jgi:hypothetical protein
MIKKLVLGFLLILLSITIVNAKEEYLAVCEKPLVIKNGRCTIPEDKILVYKEEAIEIFENYKSMKEEHDVYKKLDEWKESMFF